MLKQLNAVTRKHRNPWATIDLGRKWSGVGQNPGLVFTQPPVGIFGSIVLKKLMREMKRGVFCSGGVQPLAHASDHRQLAEGSFNTSDRHRIFQVDLAEFYKFHQHQAAKA